MKRKNNKCILTFLLFCMFYYCGYSELLWKNKVVTIQGKLNQKDIPVKFEFKNTGESEVTFTSIRSSCSCYPPKLNKETYQPGEKGELDIIFNVYSKTGTQKGKIYLLTTDNLKKPVVLEFCVILPLLFKQSINPPLIWHTTKEVKDKVVKLINNTEKPLKITNINTISSNFITQLKIIKLGYEYELTISPINKKINSGGIIEILTDYKVENVFKKQRFKVYTQK